MAIISTSAELLIYLGVSISVIKLRKNKDDVPKSNSFKIPGGYTIPILSCIVCVWFLSNLSKNEFFAILLYIIILTIIYFLSRSWMKSNDSLS